MSEHGVLSVESEKQVGPRQVFRAGPPVTVEQLRTATNGMESTSRRITLGPSILEPFHGDPVMLREVTDFLSSFSDFAEGAVTRADQPILLKATSAKWKADKAATNWRGVVDQLYMKCGKSSVAHTLREDEGPNGSMVTAGVWGDRKFYFIESAIPGVGRNTVRQLRAVSATYTELMSELNEYSYDERAAAGEVLDVLLSQTEVDDKEKARVKKAVLDVANRITTPTHKELKEAVHAELKVSPQRRTVSQWVGGLIDRRPRIAFVIQWGPGVNSKRP